MSDHLLLDTCALIWLSVGGGALSKTALSMVESARTVFASAISAFEISMKYHQGGLELPCDPERWYSEMLKHHDILEIEINSSIAITSTKLPPYHQDPCDRFIIATAMRYHLTIVTADRRFEDYGVQIIK